MVLFTKSVARSASAGTAVLVLLTIFTAVPLAQAATAPAPDPQQAMPLGTAFDFLDTLLEPYGMRGALDAAEALFASPGHVLPGDLLDPDRPHHTYEIAEGVVETYGVDDVVTIDDDWIVRGTLVLNGADVVFSGPRFIRVEASGTLDVNPGTRFWTVPANLDAPGVIIQRGGILDVDGTAADPVYFTDVSISTARPVWNGSPGSASIDHARFDHVRVGVQARHANVEVHHSSFQRTAIGVQILEGNTTYQASVNVENSTFVGNEIGVQFALGQDNLGKVAYSTFRANAVGVNCLNHNETVGTRPLITHNNFTMNYQEAYEGRIGLTVSTPAATVSIAPSKCRITNNYIHSSNGVFPPQNSAVDNEEYSGNQGTSPWTDLQTPPEPVTPRIITNIQTWNQAAGHVLNGPVVVTQGGDLRVLNTRLVQNGYPLGTTLGGKFRIENTRSDNAAIIARTADSVTNGLRVEGNSLFSGPFIVYRNSGAHSNFQAYNITKGTAFTARGGLAVDDVWSISLDGCVGRNVFQFVVTLLMTVELSDCDFDYVYNGVIAALGQATLDNIQAKHFNLAVTSLLANTLVANNVRLDGGVNGIISAIDQSIEITNGYATSTRVGAAAVIEVNGASVDNFHLAFNTRGFLNAASVTTITDSNLEHNYFFGIENVAVSNAQSTISCTCWTPADEDTEGVVTLTQPLNGQPYPTPKPNWWGQQEVIETPSNRTVSGRLEHPVLARNGGVISIVDTTIDGILEQPIGVKNDRNNPGVPGRIYARNAVFRDLNFLALDSGDTQFIDTDFGPGAFLTSLDHHPTARCTNFQFGGAYWTLVGDSLSPFRVRRSHIMDQHTLTVGTSSTDMDVTFEDNLIGPETRTTVRTHLTRNIAGDWQVHRNNVGAQLKILDNRETASEPDLQLSDNFWGHPSGPRKVEATRDILNRRVTQNLYTNEQGTVLEYWAANPPATAPVRQQVVAHTPCVRFDLPVGVVDDGAPVSFLDRSFALTPDGISERTWSWGDGDPAETVTSTTPSHQFRDAGTHTVSLRIRAPLAQWDLVGGVWTKTTPTHVEATVTKPLVVVNAPPVAQFTWSPTVAADDTHVSFAHASYDPSRLGSIASVRWDFGDGSSSTLAAPDHQFPDDGRYRVCLTATDNDGATNTRCQDVDVANAPPTVDFTHTPVVPDDGHAASFNAVAQDPSPSGSIVNYQWAFGDTESGSGAHPQHTYRNDGSFNTCVTVRDDDGATANACRSVTVTNAPPQAGFGLVGGAHTDGAPVAFVDQSTDPSRGGPITSWAWDFGDGQTSNQRSPSHQFGDDGVYEVCLTVADGDGATDQACAPVSVANAPPIASFSFSPLSPDPETNVTFDATASTDPSPAGGIVTYQWTFSDGATASGALVTRSFAQEGIYGVTLTVTDDEGATANASRQVGVGNKAPYWDPFVLAPPVLEGRWLDVTVHAVDPEGSPVTYTSADLPAGATLDGQSGRLRWRPSDGQAGEYGPTIVASDGELTTDRILEITVLDNQAPSLSITTPTLTEARRVDTYSCTTSDPEGTSVSVVWSFRSADGSVVTKAGKSVTHSFPTMGTYTVTATATDADGIQTSRERTVQVDDIITATVAKVAPSGDPRPHDPVTIRVVVKDDRNLAVAGASVSVAIRNADAVNLQSTVTGTTDASGVFQFTHTGPTPVAHLPGDHVMTATVTAASRAGAPHTGLEVAVASGSYHVFGDADDLCPLGPSAEDCTEFLTRIVDDSIEALEDFCGGSLNLARCLENVPNPCSGDGGGTQVDACVEMVEAACERLGEGSGVAACTNFVLGLVGTVTNACENMGDAPGVGGCVDYVTGLIECDGASASSSQRAAGCVPQKAVECVTGLLGTPPTNRQQVACDLT